MNKRIFSIILIALFVLTTATAAFSENAYRLLLDVNGKKHTVNALKKDGKVHIQAEDLSKIFNAHLRYGFRKHVVFLNRTPIKGCPLYAGKRYIRVSAAAKVLNFKFQQAGEKMIRFYKGDKPPASASSSGGALDVKIIRKEKTSSSNPNEITYTLGVSLANRTDAGINISNNNFALEEDSGRKHPVNRRKFGSPVFVEPGKTAKVDRIYFTVPKDAKIKYLLVFKRRKILGKTSF